MPYEIEKRKNKTYKVVNKETGKVMSKGTTKIKAEKQIKAIYANMKPEHRLRHRIGLLQDRHIASPLHRAIIQMASGLLKKEEIHGNGFWNSVQNTFKKATNWVSGAYKDVVNAFDFRQNPMLNLVLTGFAQDPLGHIGDALSDYGLDAVELLMPELAPAIEALKPVVSTFKPKKKLDKELEKGLEEQPEYEDEDEEEEYDQEEDDKLNHMPLVERLDKMVEHIVDKSEEDAKIQDINTLNNPFFIDGEIRFPMVYNYDENNRPMALSAFLLANGTSGHNHSREEFGDTYLNQKPYAFLDHPLNGGRLGRINYSKLGFSKY